VPPSGRKLAISGLSLYRVEGWVQDDTLQQLG
jgi:hypothetical protein